MPSQLILLQVGSAQATSTNRGGGPLLPLSFSPPGGGFPGVIPLGILGHPSKDFRSTTILSSSGGTAPANSGATEALAVIQSCFNIDSTMTTRRLVEVRKNYYIAPEYELHVPLPGECPYDTFPSDFSLPTDALEAGLRFPLHPVIEACLEGWQISPSQMAPNS
ncbi:hypothetical protein BHM03_00036703 [Ensete ventricosum]|nr:hypothetical protein BHM03_00036703 [Ensete ventricosum]